MLSAAIKFLNYGLCEFYFSTALHTVIEVCLEYCVTLKHLFLAPVKIILKVIFSESSISPRGQVKECMERCVVGNQVLHWVMESEKQFHHRIVNIHAKRKKHI